jgi:hypothetical protein
MVRTHYPTAHACGAEENQKKMGILKYGFYDQATPDELHKYVQLHGKPYSKVGLSDHQTTRYTAKTVLMDTMLLEKYNHTSLIQGMKRMKAKNRILVGH